MIYFNTSSSARRVISKIPCEWTGFVGLCGEDIDYVLSHPNGWEGIQQMQMRQAAVQAGLIPDTTKGHAWISFVMEGEASLHFSIQNGLPSGAMKVGGCGGRLDCIRC